PGHRADHAGRADLLGPAGALVIIGHAAELIGTRPGLSRLTVSVEIEIWSDVVCPWCYIGKHRLERALNEFEHADQVAITWRSFQLNPDMPAGQAVPTVDYMARRFGPESKAMVARMAGLGAAEGLAFD